MVGMEDAELPFVSGTEALTTLNHSVAGNPDRLRHGLIRLRQDDRWRSGMARRDQRLVSVLTCHCSCTTDTRCGPRRPSCRHVARPSSTAHRAARALRGALTRRVRRHVRWGRTEGWARDSSRRTSSTR